MNSIETIKRLELVSKRKDENGRQQTDLKLQVMVNTGTGMVPLTEEQIYQFHAPGEYEPKIVIDVSG